MKITYEFTVGVPVDQAWNTMLDLERITPCLPGAAIHGKKADGGYDGTIKVKVGPITAGYEGTARFEEADEPNHRAVLQATGHEVRGQGTASATIVSTLQEVDDGTKVNVETDLRLTGRAAQFGRGIAQDVATKMLDEFVACLEQEISVASEATQAAPVVEPATGNGPPPAAVVGGTVEGAIVAGPSPSKAAAGAPTTGIRQPTTQEAIRRPPPEEVEAFDPGATGQGADFKRLAPALAGAGLLVVLIWLLRRRR